MAAAACPITGGGSQGAGARFLGRLLLFGGDLGDTLIGGDGADLYGGVGVDVLEGRLEGRTCSWVGTGTTRWPATTATTS